MRQNLPNIIVFVVLAVTMTGLYWYGEQAGWFPKPPVPEKKDAPAEEPKDQPPAATADAKLAAGGGLVAAIPPKPAPAPEVKPAPPPAPPSEPATLIALGGPGFNNRFLLSTRGAGVQQAVIPTFNEADRLGLEVKKDGQPVPLYLIPGVIRTHGKFLREEFLVPDLQPGKVPDNVPIAEPSYTLFHYLTPDDKHPVPLLGETNWKVVSEDRPEGGPHTVVFETELGDPYFVTFRKTYTLSPKDYHVGMRLDIKRWDAARLPPGWQKGKGVLRLQMSGPRGLPIEGEWYTYTYRAALAGWVTPKGVSKRSYDDAASITTKRGGDQIPRADNTWKYAAIATQYFTSALAIDTSVEGAAKNPWALVRATSELPLLPSAEEYKQLEQDAKTNPVAAILLARARDSLNRKMPELDDITFRAVTEPLDLAAGETVTHAYLIYNGPAKVRLLGLMSGDRAVDPALVDRYLNDLDLKTISDYQSPTWLGSFANSIYWSDLVIVFTNLMHWLLAVIHSAIGSWGLSILVLTVMVRLLLFVPSKKQTQMNLKMMEIQKKLQPELNKLHEKYKDDLQTYNREKTRLMMQNGVNPFVMMGGCLLLFAQMPIMMGLYYCLQESIFFRLEPFLWIRNLAAPDMTVWWTENVPLISDPENRWGTFSFLYLGPYLNILPLLAVGLMLYQQIKMMPPPTDEQMASQQRMMKFMMILMGFLFYKVAAGLALYFIITTLWGIVERRLIPKSVDTPPDAGGAAAASANGTGKDAKAEPAKPKGILGRFKQAMQEKMEELKKQAEDQAARQIRNDRDRPDPSQRRDNRDKKKRRK